MDRLEDLKMAQERIDALQSQGVEMNSPEARSAVNRLITLVRGATPDILQVFDAWKQARKAGAAHDL